MAAGSNGTAVAAALLGFFLLVELAVRFQLDRMSIVSLSMTQSVAGAASGWLVLSLLCLSTTLPVAFRRPEFAAAAVAAGAVMSFVFLHMLKIPGAAAQLISGYRLGRSDSHALGVLLGAPF